MSGPSIRSSGRRDLRRVFPVPLAGRAALFDTSLATMQRIWHATGDRPRILLGGTVRASLVRAVTEPSEGWVAPLFDLALLREGGAAVDRAWTEAGREGRPRIVTGRYFSLGPDADATADEYIKHYYGADFFQLARADTLTDVEQIHTELRRLTEAGCADVISADLERLAGLQQEDGGWIVDFLTISPAGSLDWRGHATVRAIDVLRRNARMT